MEGGREGEEGLMEGGRAALLYTFSAKQGLLPFFWLFVRVVGR